jgi:DNA polymerase-3 subunit epsilon
LTIENDEPGESMEKLFVFDLETTGVKYWRNGIHQISGMIVIDGDIKEKFDFKVQPNPKCTIEDEALVISRVTREQILQYPEMKSVYTEIISILEKYVDKYNKMDKFHLVGFNNASFDNQFFRGFFVQNGDNYFGSWFYPDSLDVYVLASMYLLSEREKLLNFRQSTVARYLVIEVDEDILHDAEYDISICYEIFKKVRS